MRLFEKWDVGCISPGINPWVEKEEKRVWVRKCGCLRNGMLVVSARGFIPGEFGLPDIPGKRMMFTLFLATCSLIFSPGINPWAEKEENRFNLINLILLN